uniref:VHL domain-containing protein n=1 Tax=Strongyloides papillosus TaxID=174720 RepID=A0A0N5B8X3_STREA
MDGIEIYDSILACGHKSPNSIDPVRIVFRNTLRKHICIYWIDHNGKFTFYGLLPSRKNLTIDSYTGHLWCVRCFETGNLIKLKLTHENGSSYLKEVPSIDELHNYQRNFAVFYPVEEVKSLRDILLTYFSKLPQESSIESLPLPDGITENIIRCSQFTKNFHSQTRREVSMAMMERH